jgi:hypothetical protein
MPGLPEMPGLPGMPDRRIAEPPLKKKLKYF